uniref:Uncharacterized protein n=1 Tax=Sphaerodactylus townsendi TaxID=933632 RepID=A0ACB8FZJ3_9SAUR
MLWLSKAYTLEIFLVSQWNLSLLPLNIPGGVFMPVFAKYISSLLPDQLQRVQVTSHRKCLPGQFGEESGALLLWNQFLQTRFQICFFLPSQGSQNLIVLLFGNFSSLFPGLKLFFTFPRAVSVLVFCPTLASLQQRCFPKCLYDVALCLSCFSSLPPPPPPTNRLL